MLPPQVYGAPFLVHLPTSTSTISAPATPILPPPLAVFNNYFNPTIANVTATYPYASTPAGLFIPFGLKELFNFASIQDGTCRLEGGGGPIQWAHECEEMDFWKKNKCLLILKMLCPLFVVYDSHVTTNILMCLFTIIFIMCCFPCCHAWLYIICVLFLLPNLSYFSDSLFIFCK